MELEWDWENKKYTYIACAVLALITVISLIINFSIKRENDSQVLRGQKTLGHYKIMDKSGPSPFTVTLFEVETGNTYEGVFISALCPDYKNINTSKTYQLFRYNNFHIKSGVTSYTYEGLYEAVCTSVKKEINEDI